MSDIYKLAEEFTETLRREQEIAQDYLYELEEGLYRTPQEGRAPARVQLMEAYQHWLRLTKMCEKYHITIKG